MPDTSTLKDVALELLNKWYSHADALVWETSISIKKDLEDLKEEYESYKELIESLTK